MNNRERLSRIVRGEVFDKKERFRIEYSVDIRGNLTIWGGMSYFPEEMNVFDDRTKRVSRLLVPLFYHHHCSPYTARIFQIEEALDDKIEDSVLIEEFRRFRQDHPKDGFGFRLELCRLGDKTLGDLSCYRSDMETLWNQKIEQERKDIRSLFGVDVPKNRDLGLEVPNVSDGTLSGEWYKREFLRIGGDPEDFWNRHRSGSWTYPFTGPVFPNLKS